MISPGELMTRVRELWRSEVCASAAKETSPDSPVVRAFRDARTRLEADESLDVKQAVEHAVYATEEWMGEHKQTIREMYLSVHDRAISEHELCTLAALTDTEEIAEKIVDLSMEDPESVQSPAARTEQPPGEVSGETDAVTDAAGAHPMHEGRGHQDHAQQGHEQQVDEAWLSDFAEAYGRDAYVHEYVLVRGMGDLKRHAETHRAAFEGLRTVHAQFLGENLTETDFVKTYVPEALVQPDIVDSVRSASIERPQYRKAMIARLSHLHAVLCGAELAEEEAAFLFESEVLDKRLPLDTDVLNDVVTEFVMHGESLRAVIKGLYTSYLGRDAELDEVDEWLFSFRKCPDDSKVRLRKQLCKCHEFHAVITDRIRSSKPDIRTADAFRLLDEALRSVDFMNIDTVNDLDHALETSGVLNDV
jgi:hypothetical protein